MSDDRPRPGVSPITWATLALLLAPWWLVSAVSAADLLRSPLDARRVGLNLAVWAVGSAPLVLFVAAVWFGRRTDWPSRAALPAAVIYNALAIVLCVCRWGGVSVRELMPFAGTAAVIGGLLAGLLMALLLIDVGLGDDNESAE